MDSQCTGGRWIPAQVKGYREDVSVALTGVAEEISIPVGAFSKCRLRVFTCKLQTHSDSLFLCGSPINQLAERKTPWPGLNPPGSGGSQCAWYEADQPPFQIYCMCQALALLGNRVCRLVSVKTQTSWRKRVLFCLTTPKLLQGWGR